MKIFPREHIIISEFVIDIIPRTPENFFVNAHDVILIIQLNVLRAGRHKFYSVNAGKLFVINFMQMNSFLPLLLDIAKHNPPDSRANLVEFAVYAGHDNFFLVFYAEILQQINPLLEIFIAVSQCTALDRVIKFGRVKAEHGNISKRPDTAPANFHAERMSRIVNHAQAVTVGDFLNFFHRAGRPEYVNRQNRGRVRRYHRLDFIGVNVHGLGVNVTENWRDIIPTQDVRRRGKCKWRRNDFAAQAQTLTRHD